jgi:murein DD-endopeptidase MepM/ murein hydrolase activator NlpD
MMRGGKSHKGNGKNNEHYYCFGKRVLAPGAGVVVALANGVEDNVPGEMNPRQAMGNYVIIDHGNGEYSFLAHFKKGSVAVAQDQRVELREFLGLCGNSGNSSEPHIHYHLQTTAWFQQGKGLPAQFQDYVADGKPVKRGEPVKGQAVR